MQPIVLFLMAITMDSHTGEQLSATTMGAPFDSVEACSAAQQKTGTQQPKDGKITVYQCGLLPPGDQST